MTDNFRAGWISVEDKLPDKGAECLAWDEEKGMYLAGRIGFGSRLGWVAFPLAREHTVYLEEVTHWMPLPGEPKNDR